MSACIIHMLYSPSGPILMKQLMSMDYQKEWLERNNHRIAEEKRKQKVLNRTRMGTIRIGMRIVIYFTGEEETTGREIITTFNENTKSDRN